MEKTATKTKDKAAPFYAVIVAAGSGARMGADVPKQYMNIAGRPVLRHTLERFLACPGLRGIHVVINPAHRALYDAATAGLALPAPINGGDTRKDSVFNGLESFSKLTYNDTILIHDAARPFITPAEIAVLVDSIQTYEAATLAVPVADSLRHGDQQDDAKARAFVDRKGLLAIQTPQAFRYGVIMESHNKADPANEWTDDTGLASAAGFDVAVVTGKRQNFKITTADDLEMADNLMRGTDSMRTRTGMGFDVHAFAQIMGGPVRLCGVDVDHPHRLYGHSDADVALHAITDALLGAIAAGDIGEHFPPTDPQWKGLDSAYFLSEAVRMITDKKGEIVNIDVTIICESPKIGPHRAKMQERVAEICNIAVDQVNIKATTTEKMGFTGREEGIAAQAIATVQVP
ncbi:MAG: bifunctional 2-C-methyl-D-erythritol 4-phosphate cytidylyltransferase/2-C-methyl-D-erythritol 2,4-cyclodiphosphate synthase [Alphaproteobacteria bacterium]|nr:bifunctional 2-C-methyl-D-erythritol 4-phosphate cytidylyltransferase/2-C-methyl-D-erythritol 2,4-cyclodiphosphate synthase [Alphaproteobacteria bacterium]MBU0860168.1 bifunctional 2-C-methyl-D-erythritol 4-phosphate cytidylyltransferase/2-C-methyl-D-erythritol 2,4-cyclodiphosphate synthase [Alphaproteobacteria bacterium]